MAESSRIFSPPVTEIKRWIQDGFRAYGPDPWLFLRELAQNSRDAGARKIDIQVHRDSRNQEILEFRDDGQGMSERTARDYLFRFYASSKEDSAGKAGRFGIGFWSVWRFAPARLIIESRRGGQSWSVEVDRDFNVRRLPAPDLERGTRVLLQRPAAFPDAESFSEAVNRAAHRYCGHLLRLRPFHRTLPVKLNGHRVSRPLLPAGMYGRTFRSRRFCGGTALGREPEVRVFSGGLPIWRGTSIAELTGNGKAEREHASSVHGLYPVVWLECPNLRVDLSRRHPVNDPELKALRRRGERETARLFARILNRGAGRSTAGRIRDGAEALALHLRGRIWLQAALLLLLLIPVEITLLRYWLAPSGEPQPRDPVMERLSYKGTTIDVGGPLNAPNLEYTPGKNLFFRLFTVEHFDSLRGFVYRRGTPGKAPEVQPSRERVEIDWLIQGKERIMLPHPVGFHILASSLRWNGRSLGRIPLAHHDSYQVDLPVGIPGRLQYTCFPVDPAVPPDRDSLQTLQSPPPPDNWPENIRALLRRGKESTINQRVEMVRRKVTELLSPMAAREAARRFRQARGPGWIRRVLQTGGGDCDVINGLAVVMLRGMEIPARLGIGWVGRNGRLTPGLHAWVEFHHNGWNFMDLSGAGNSASTQSQPALNPAKHIPAATKWASTILAPLLAFASLLVMGLIFRRRKIRENPRRDEILSSLVLGALLYPGRWGSHNRMWTTAVLPSLSGSRISLRRAFSRMHERGLYSASPGNPLAGRKNKVLDAGNPHFRRIFRLVYGVIDLDSIHSLEIQAFKPGGTHDNAMTRRLDDLGRSLGKWGWRVVIATGAENGAPRWIDLSGLGLRIPALWRRPLLVLSAFDLPGSHAWSRNTPYPGGHLFRIIADSMSIAPLLTPKARETLHRLARRLLEEKP